jgi:hypothetical protein
MSAIPKPLSLSWYIGTKHVNRMAAATVVTSSFIATNTTITKKKYVQDFGSIQLYLFRMTSKQSEQVEMVGRSDKWKMRE